MADKTYVDFEEIRETVEALQEQCRRIADSTFADRKPWAVWGDELCCVVDAIKAAEKIEEERDAALEKIEELEELENEVKGLMNLGDSDDIDFTDLEACFTSLDVNSDDWKLSSPDIIGELYRREIAA